MCSAQQAVDGIPGGAGKNLDTETGEDTADDSCNQQKRQIPENRQRFGDQHGNKELGNVVNHGADRTDCPDEFIFQMDIQEEFSHQTADSAGHTVKEGDWLAGEDCAQCDAHDEDDGGLAPAQKDDGKQGDNVRKTQFDPWDRDGKGELLFHPKDGQGDGGKQRHEDKAFGSHGETPFRI